MLNEISTTQLAELICKEKHRIIDVRPIDAYNGWVMKGERRGGHISGARTVPASWTDEENWDEIIRAKDIMPNHRIVVYGYSKDDAAEVAQRLDRSGFKRVALYNHFLDEWTLTETLPMDRLERFERLVHPGWVHRIVSGGAHPGFNGKKYAICHCHYRNKTDYEIGHIPGAISLDTLELESPDTWNRRSPEDLKQRLMKLGISADTTVVVYGRFSSPHNSDPHPGSKAGHLGSIRCAVLLMYAGVRDVRVLNGSIAAWSNMGYSLSTDETQLEPVSEFGATVPARPQIFIDMPQVKRMLKTNSGNLVSVTSWAEYIGKVSGYNYIFKKGRIPGSIFGNCGSDAYHMENYRNIDLTAREYHEVEAMWNSLGITSEKFNVFYCGTGWRASEAFLNAYIMGWNKIAVYDGGWYEWSQNPGNPIVVGGSVSAKVI